MEIGQQVYIQGFGNAEMTGRIIDKYGDSYKVKTRFEQTVTLDKDLCYAEPQQHCSNPYCVGLTEHIIKQSVLDKNK